MATQIAQPRPAQPYQHSNGGGHDDAELRAAVQEAVRKLKSDAVRREFASQLPDHVPVERYVRTLQTAMINTPRLCLNWGMLKKEALKIAAMGLSLEPHMGEAALILDNRGNIQARIMYRGLIRLARQSGEVAALYAHEVCRHDHTYVSLGTEKRIEHTPNFFADRGDPIAYYAVCKFKDGEVDFEIMSMGEIEKVRRVSSPSTKGPWAIWPEEMAKKTVLRRLLKRLPKSADVGDALQREDALDDAAAKAKDVTPDLQDLVDDQTVEHDEDGVIHDDGQDQQAEPPRNGQPAIEHRPEQQVGQVQAGRDDAVPAHVIDGPSDDFFTD